MIPHASHMACLPGNRTGFSGASFSNTALLLFLLFMATGACSHVQVARSRQGLMLHSMPPGALVYGNRKYWGTGAELERHARELPAGSHELLIVAPGHYPYYSRFTLKKGELLRRKPHLVPQREK